MKMKESRSQGFDSAWNNPFGVFVLKVWDANINALQYPPYQLCSYSHIIPFGLVLGTIYLFHTEQFWCS